MIIVSFKKKKKSEQPIEQLFQSKYIHEVKTSTTSRRKEPVNTILSVISTAYPKFCAKAAWS